MAKLIDFRNLEEGLKTSFENGLSKTLDFKFFKAHEDGIEVQVLVSEKHSRSGGIANGGLALTLLESVGSISAYAQIDYENFNAFGTSVSMNHIRAAKLGETLSARSKPVHIGRSTQVWDVEIKNEKGQTTSNGRITLLVIPN